LSWLEHHLDMVGVDGSSPFRRTILYLHSTLFPQRIVLHKSFLNSWFDRCTDQQPQLSLHACCPDINYLTDFILFNNLKLPLTAARSHA
ncbi:TPA: hypothetical protein ACKE1R_004704, partial [Citrobacter koseri]